MNVVGVVIILQQVKIVTMWIALGLTANGQNSPEILDCVSCVLSGIFDSQTLFYLKQHTFIPFFPDRADVMDEPLHRHWARTTRQAFATALPGGYPNLLGPNDPDRARHSYGCNAKRLMEAKRCYDPDNVFSSAIPLPRAV